MFGFFSMFLFTCVREGASSSFRNMQRDQLVTDLGFKSKKRKQEYPLKMICHNLTQYNNFSANKISVDRLH